MNQISPPVAIPVVTLSVVASGTRIRATGPTGVL